MALADRTGGVIINADSAQLYRDLPIVSAAPPAQDLARAEHRLFGVLDGAERCSAADWAALASREIQDVHASGRRPILVGGTGLYLRALLDGIAPVPPIDADVRHAVRAADVTHNHARLEQLDPEAAGRLNPSDTTRIARALEVVLSTGRPLAAWQVESTGGLAESVELHPLILLPPRDWLYDRCDRRFEQMTEAGGVEEIRALLARNLDPALPVMRAIGVREIAAHVLGETSLEEAIAAGQQATRRYAKRQYTWFSHQPPAAWSRWTEPLDISAEGALELLAAKD